MNGPFPFADRALSRSLELAEGIGSSRFVEARARLFPDSGATWIEVAGARAMYDGAASPITQTFGLGLFQPATAADLDAIEAFYSERGASVFHEVSPMADEGLPAMLAARGYAPCEFTSVLYRPIPPPATEPGGLRRDRPPVHVRRVEQGEEELYARTSAAGWSEAGLGDFVLDLGRVSGAVKDLHLFLAESEGRPIAAAALSLCGPVGHLAGASTIPGARGQGAQLALLDHRLRDAADHGCEIALMGASPGSSSQRNAERNGFRIAYTRIKWWKP
jgi:GNAT superfamily N-acetyltransferase